MATRSGTGRKLKLAHYDYPTVLHHSKKEKKIVFISYQLIKLLINNIRVKIIDNKISKIS